MAEIVGIISSVAGLIDITTRVLALMKGFHASHKQAPAILVLAIGKVTMWEYNLKELSALGRNEEINDHLKQTLLQSGVLGNVQQCLERLNDIIIDATPAGKQTGASKAWDKATFRLGAQSEVQGLLKKLDENAQDLSLAMHTNTFNEVRRVRESLEKHALAMVTGKEADEALSWLEPDFNPVSTDPVTLHSEKSDQQEPDTCTWMTASAQWQDWLQGGSIAADGHRRFMWIHGLPGTGKTILASFLIDVLPPFGSSYYYCFEGHNRDETVPFLRWVIRDLCKQLQFNKSLAGRPLPQGLRWLRERNKLTVETLKDCLEGIVTHFHTQHKKRVYIIVDAVDESLEPRNRLLDVLTAIGTDSRFETVSLLFTSRPHRDIKEAIESLPRISLPMRPHVLRAKHTGQPQSSSSFSMTEPRDNNLFGLEPEKRSCNRGEGRLQPPSDRNLPQSIGTASSTEGQDDNIVGSSGRVYPFAGFEPPSRHVSQSPETITWSEDDSITHTPTSRSSRAPSPEKRYHPGDRVDSPSKRPRRGSTQPGLSPCTILSMANTDVQKAIETYLDRRLREHRNFQYWIPFLREMKRELAFKAGGIFRIVSCHLDLISRRGFKDRQQIMNCINEMPATVYDTYEKILVEGVEPDDDSAKYNMEFTRTALALMCSETSKIPDAGVLVEAARTDLPQRVGRFYDCTRLKELLGCLVKESSLPKPQRVFHPRGQEDADATLRLSVAHYTVKEFLYSVKAAQGQARYFALSDHITQKLELRIVFEGLQLFNPETRSGQNPSRFHEYCLVATEQALAQRPALVGTDKELWEAVFPCLAHNSPHLKTLSQNKQLVKANFPVWNSLSPFADDEPPSQPETSVLVNLLLLDWPELARIYLETLTDQVKPKVWKDKFKLKSQTETMLPQSTLAQMCVSRRRLDFLKIFTANGARFRRSPDILFRALNEPYGKHDPSGGHTTELLLKELLDRGANPNPAGFSVTPLQVATHYHERPWVHLLLWNQANAQGVGEADGGLDPFASNGIKSPPWYLHTPLKICADLERQSDQNTTARARQVKRLLQRSLGGEILEDSEIIIVD